jgi:hypothetical protein
MTFLYSLERKLGNKNRGTLSEEMCWVEYLRHCYFDCSRGEKTQLSLCERTSEGEW